MVTSSGRVGAEGDGISEGSHGAVSGASLEKPFEARLELGASTLRLWGFTVGTVLGIGPSGLELPATG